MRITTVAATVVGTLVLAACSAPPKQQEPQNQNPIQITQDPSGFQNIEAQVGKLPAQFLRNGKPIDMARFAQVKPGATRQTVLGALGEPVQRSGDGRSYDYDLTLPLQGRNTLVCQYRVSFDARETVTSTQWRRPQCEALANAMQPAPVPVPAPAPAPVRTISISADVLFEFASARLSPGGQRELDRTIEPLRGDTTPYEVHIVGHADRIGSNAANQRISLERAQSVRDYLVSRGIAASRLTVEGRGSSEPVVQCQSVRGAAALKECLAPNRRVTLNIRSTPGAGARGR